MVDIHLSGRLANNLIQYCFGRIVADAFSYSLYIKDDNHVKEFPNVRDIHRFDVKENKIEYNDTIDKNITLEQILANKKHRHIVLKGYWQKSKFFLQHRDNMRDWCYLPESQYRGSIFPNDVILHIRREDYIEAKSDLDFFYYDYCLEQIGNFNKVYIIGPSLDHRVKKHFQKFNPIYMENSSPIEDFKLLKCFKNVIMSNSTFCWMASWLSFEAERVFYPQPVSGYWSPNQNQDLYIEGFHTLVRNVKVACNGK